MKRFISLVLFVLLLVPHASATEAVLTIKDLNTNSAIGSHADDDYKTASIERNFRETVNLTQDTTGSGRFSNAYYPRVKKVNDNPYLIVWHYGRTGAHIYYATSTDCINWSAKVLYRNDTAESRLNYTEGEHAGETDRYIAVNPDAVMLDNGEILCTYYIRPNNGYTFSSDHNGLYLVRGTVNEKTK